MKPVDSYSLLLISSLFFIFSQNQFNAYPTLLDQNCSVDNYYTDSCQLHSSNLNSLLTNKLFPERESDNNGFASSFAGVYPDKYADREVYVLSMITYGFVQSTPDLSAQDCQECLGNATYVIELCSGGESPAPAIPPRPAISPPQDRTSSRSQSAKRTWITIVAGSARLAVVGSVALIGFIALIICQRKNARGT